MSNLLVFIIIGLTFMGYLWLSKQRARSAANMGYMAAVMELLHLMLETAEEHGSRDDQADMTEALQKMLVIANSPGFDALKRSDELIKAGPPGARDR